MIVYQTYENVKAENYRCSDIFYDTIFDPTHISLVVKEGHEFGSGEWSLSVLYIDGEYALTRANKKKDWEVFTLSNGFICKTMIRIPYRDFYNVKSLQWRYMHRESGNSGISPHDYVERVKKDSREFVKLVGERRMLAARESYLRYHWGKPSRATVGRSKYLEAIAYSKMGWCVTVEEPSSLTLPENRFTKITRTKKLVITKERTRKGKTVLEEYTTSFTMVKRSIMRSGLKVRERSF